MTSAYRLTNKCVCVCIHTDIPGCVCTDTQANPHPSCSEVLVDIRIRIMYGCCSCRQLRAALPLTRGAACGQRAPPGIPSAGTPGARGSCGPAPTPDLAMSRGRAPLLGLGRWRRFGSPGRGANTGRPVWARAALANPLRPRPVPSPVVVPRPPPPESWSSAAGWLGDALSFFI